MIVWWCPRPAEGELVPDFPPTDLTPMIASVHISRPDCTELGFGHEPIDATMLGDADLRFRCIKCAAEWTEPR